MSALRSEPEAAPVAKPRSPTRVFLGRLRHNRSALIGASALVVLYLGAIFGSFVGPYDPLVSHTDTPNHPPSSIRFVDADGNFHWRPFIYRTELTDVLRRVYVADETTRYPLQAWVRGEPYRLWWLFETDVHFFGVGEAAGEGSGNEPPMLYIFGADQLGRDIFSRLLAGAKISLSVGLVGIAITMTLGLLVGGISGYFGGRIDTLLMRFVELLMSVPGLYLILAIRAALSESNPLMSAMFGLDEDEHLNSGQIYLVMVIVLGFVYWAGTARVIRGMVLAIKKADYVAAAEALGASKLRVITRHLLPNTFTFVITASTISVPSYILGEVALSFLGVGIEEPQASWGNMLSDAQNLNSLVNFPWLLVPGVLIFITVFAFNFFGDGVRDALDPKHLD